MKLSLSTLAFALATMAVSATALDDAEAQATKMAPDLAGTRSGKGSSSSGKGGGKGGKKGRGGDDDDGGKV